MKLQGRVAIVTGAASGIGKACAEKFAAEGAKVVVADISEKGKDVAAALKGHYIHVDVTSAQSVEAMVNETVQHFGKLDIIMNTPASMANRRQPPRAASKIGTKS